MPFTDEDLKRLKSEIARMDQMLTLTGDSHSMDQMKGLINRLEAAEAVCQCCDDHEYNPCPGVSEGLKAWHKAAGK